MTEKVKAFNKVAEGYDDWYKHQQGKQVFYAESQARAMLPENGLGLEVGSGTRAFVKSLERSGRMIIDWTHPLRWLQSQRTNGFKLF